MDNNIIVVENEGKSKKEVAMDKAGATRERAYKAMVDGLEATTTIIDKYGDEHVVVDTSNRLRAAELITKAHGDWKENVVENKTFNVTIGGSAKEVATLLEMVKTVKEELSNLKSSGKQTGEVIDAEVV